MHGHSDKDGNFIQLLKLRATEVPELPQWLERKVDRTSHHIQNEILEMYSRSIMRSICRQIQQTDSFAVIVDGTQDISRKEQMSICIRYVRGACGPQKARMRPAASSQNVSILALKCLSCISNATATVVCFIYARLLDGSSC